MTEGSSLLKFMLLIIVILAIGAPAAWPQQQGTQEAQGWNIGDRPQNWETTTSLDIDNQCKKPHSFSIEKENLPFLDLLGNTHPTIPGHKSVTLGVRFHTDNMPPADYSGQVVVRCLDCTEVPPCVQDRSLLPVHVRVIAPAATAPPAASATPTTPTTNASRCGAITKDCGDLLTRQVQAEADAKKAAENYSETRSATVASWTSAYLIAQDEEAKAAALAATPGTTNDALFKAAADGRAKTQKAFSDALVAERVLEAAATTNQIAQQAHEKCQRDSSDCQEKLKQCQEGGPGTTAGGGTPTGGGPTGGTPTGGAPTGGTPTGGAPTGGAPTGGAPTGGTSTSGTPSTGGTTTTTTTSGGHPTTQSRPPRPVTEEDCEKLRLIAVQKEAAAAAAQANANAANIDADAKAKLAADAAAAAATAAANVPKVSEGSGWMESDGKRLTSHDLQLENEASRQAYDDYKAGKITAEQLQEIWGKWGDKEAIDKMRKAEQEKIDAAKKKAADAAQAAAAAKTIADGARANATAQQAAADTAKAEAEAARRAYDECVKKYQEQCGQTDTAGGGGGTTGGGTTGGSGTGTGTGTGGGVKGTSTGGGGGGDDGHPHTVSGCPPDDCDKLRAAWEQAKTAAAIAQAEADRAAASQAWNNSQANYLDQQAAGDTEFAKGQTDRAQQWRELAGTRAGMAEHERQIRDGYPAGSAAWNSWNNEAQIDDKEAAERNKYADELEAIEREYMMKAATATAQATQLRSDASNAQAKADAAKAAADAAYKAWQDCLEKLKKAQEDCDRQKATGTGPGTTTTPGGTPGTTSGGGGGKSTTPGGGGGGQPGPTPTGTRPDDVSTVCTRRFFSLAQHGMGNSIVVGMPRTTDPGKLELISINEGLTRTGGFTYHCKAPGTIRVVYETDDNIRHTAIIQCNASAE